MGVVMIEGVVVVGVVEYVGMHIIFILASFPSFLDFAGDKENGLRM